MERITKELKKPIYNSAFYHEKTYFNNNKPEYIYLKALIRDKSGRLKTNCLTCIQIFISRNNSENTFIYNETHPAITNAFGLVHLQVGLQYPAKFKQINWTRGPYFMKVIVDGYELMNKVLLGVI